MKRKGIHKPTIEDAVEISDIETLHPGGFELTKRTAELAQLKPGMKVLDVSSGRGTQALYYAKEYEVHVTGIDISEIMVKKANQKAIDTGLRHQVEFLQGDSQNLPFSDDTFDVVINECAVGIPDDSQRVLNEMTRVTKPSGKILIHESIWGKSLSSTEKIELSERYGTTPLEYQEWINMLKKAGVADIISEYEQWSKPEMFWKIRKDREVNKHTEVFTLSERIITLLRILNKYGIKGAFKIIENEKVYYQAVKDGKIGYCLYSGTKVVN